MEESEAAEPEQDEYEDEETQATVTILEDFDPSTSAPTVKVVETTTENENAAPTLPPIFDLPASSRKQQLKAVREKDKAKSKKKKDTGSFETKAERKKGRALETLRKNEKGALARERSGGSSRGRGGSRGGRGGGRGGSRGRGGGRGGKK